MSVRDVLKRIGNALAARAALASLGAAVKVQGMLVKRGEYSGQDHGPQEFQICDQIQSHTSAHARSFTVTPPSFSRSWLGSTIIERDGLYFLVAYPPRILPTFASPWQKRKLGKIITRPN
jgi:hypothetical protein